MKIFVIFLFLPILRALKFPSRVTNELDNMVEGISRECEDKDVLCAYVPDAFSCDRDDDIKLRCPKKCNTCPGRCILHIIDAYLILNKFT